MFNLVKKDLKIGWIFLLVMTAVIPLMTLMSLVTMSEEFGGLVLGFFIPMIIILTMVSALIFIGIDEVYCADILYASLPLKRSKIVCARYFSSFLMTLLSLGLIVLTSLAVVHVMQKTDPLLKLFMNFRGIFATFLFLGLILIFILPFIFRFGTTKGLLAAISAQIGLFFIIQFFKFILKALRGIFSFDLAFLKGFFNSIGRWVTGLETDETYLLMFIGLIILILLSLGLSTRFFKNKDL